MQNVDAHPGDGGSTKNVGEMGCQGNERPLLSWVLRHQDRKEVARVSNGITDGDG